MRQLSVRASHFKGTMERRHVIVGHALRAKPLRFLDSQCHVLSDRTFAREPMLLAASNERFEHARRCDVASAVARLSAFESAYLSLAAVIRPAEVVEQAHPGIDLVEAATRRLRLFREDAILTAELARIYGLPGWQALDLETIFEWVARVRLAAYRYLQSGE